MKIPKKPSGRKRSPFYWWRRFKSHKYLPHNASLLRKIENGDYNYPDLFKHAEWELVWMKEEQEEFIKNYQGKNYEHDNLYEDIERRARKRYNKLYEDAIKDETDRMERLINGLSKYFKIKKDNIRNIIEEFDGTTEELYFSLQRGWVS